MFLGCFHLIHEDSNSLSGFALASQASLKRKQRYEPGQEWKQSSRLTVDPGKLYNPDIYRTYTKTMLKWMNSPMKEYTIAY
jgi:hypothetical protein